MISVGGENLIDLVAADTAPLTYVAAPGGGPFNVALAIGRQGQNVTYLTPISNDAFGTVLANRLYDANVKLAAPRVTAPSSLAIVSIDPSGVPSYGFYRNGTAERQVSRGALAEWMPQDTTIFHIGGLALIEGEDADAWVAEFQRCRNANILTSLDPNVRPALITDWPGYRKRLRQLMQIADIVKLSDEDLQWLYPDRSLDAALNECRADCGASLFILTVGDAGAKAYAGTLMAEMPCYAVPSLIDTVGAGDTFMASVLCWLLETQRMSSQSLSSMDASALRDMLSRANKAAALNCGHAGCNPPWRDQLDI